MVNLPVAAYNGMTRIQLRIMLFRRQEGKCAWCEQFFFTSRRLTQKLRSKLSSPHINIDHTWPQSHGGPSELWNVTLMHRDCNQQKGDSCEYERCIRCGRVPDTSRNSAVDQDSPAHMEPFPAPRSEEGREPVLE